jgi:hypothetical protein
MEAAVAHLWQALRPLNGSWRRPSRLNTVRTGLQLGITCFDISVKAIVIRTLDEEANERDNNVLINLLKLKQDGYIPA